MVKIRGIWFQNPITRVTVVNQSGYIATRDERGNINTVGEACTGGSFYTWQELSITEVEAKKSWMIPTAMKEYEGEVFSCVTLTECDIILQLSWSRFRLGLLPQSRSFARIGVARLGLNPTRRRLRKKESRTFSSRCA